MGSFLSLLLLLVLFSVQTTLHFSLPLSDLFRVRRGSYPDVPGQGHTSPFQSADCGELFSFKKGRPRSTGRLHMPLWTDVTVVSHGCVKRSSCLFGRPDSAQCPCSRRDAFGGEKIQPQKAGKIIHKDFWKESACVTPHRPIP